MAGDKIDHRKVYSAGYFAGLEAARKENADVNPVRMQSIEQNLSAVAKKVLCAVPIGEPWSKNQIRKEIARSSGHVENRTVDGCLQSLCESGVIREPLPGMFVRVKVTETREPIRLVKDPPMKTAVSPILATTKAKSDNLEAIADIAKRLRGIASEVEEIGIAMQSEVSSSAAESAKLAQLKDLLKSLT